MAKLTVFAKNNIIRLMLKKKALLSHGEPRDSAVNFDSIF